ncbi:Bgt-3656 [Blumeria graminis f. sp. tritici]|uniref:Signal peptidase subunit 3 n=2 Tax=Blumeria graminis f. sp. tritici TaxID=62690 RepID=A0A381LGV6_BLUGR|nr:Subunit of signal peptidase complex [Blumeria graminis f. sp. tritici 96224]VCU40621.1 Bgt-3656 [Blumeria graminis f. sp. tritici]
MFSTSNRLQNLFGFFTTVALVLGALIAASDLLAPRTPRASLSLKDVNVIRGRPNHYSTKREDYGVIRFSLSADLSSLFTWNTKQVFVYVSATWPNSTSSQVSNEVVIWDSIITNPSADHLLNVGPATKQKLIKSSQGLSIDPRRGKLELRNQRAKYHITTPTGRLADTKNVTLRLHYNVQPWIGVLTWTPSIEFGRWKKMNGGMSKAFKFPSIKATGASKA